jgi:alpha-N-arabinofuranosidase
VAGFLHAFIRHADVLKIANLAQIVNVIAPILTKPDDLLVQSIYWPFALFSKRRDGVSLAMNVEGPTYASASHGTVHHVDASAILGEDRLHVFLTNRDEEAAGVTVHLADARITAQIDAEILTAADPKASNGWDTPDVVRAVPFDACKIEEGRISFELPAMCFVATSFQLN